MCQNLHTKLLCSILMMITYATTFFKPFFFEAALSVNLTTMLVMTTIFISKMEGLPPTSATKMIDYWLILCQLVPFAQVVLLTAMEYLREEEHMKSQHDAPKDFTQQVSSTKNSTLCTIQYESEKEEDGMEPKIQEAWKGSEPSLVPKLMQIGKFLYSSKQGKN